MGKDDCIISDTDASYNGKDERLMIASNGFEDDSLSSQFRIYQSVMFEVVDFSGI